MANSDLYKVLSGLHTSDVLISGKLAQLSGQVMPAFSDDKITIGTANGIEASTYSISTHVTSGEFDGSVNLVATEAGAKAYVDGVSAAIVDSLDSSKITTFADGGALSGSIANNTLTVGVLTDGNTIAIENDKLTSKLQIAKVTAGTGYAATYELQDATGARLGQPINIAKDQFLSGASYNSETEQLILTFAVADVDANGNTTGDTIAQTVTIDASDLVHEYESGNGVFVGSTANGKSVISGVVASGNDYLSVGATGFTFDDAALSSMVDAKISAFETAKELSGVNYESRLAAVESATTGGLSGVAANSNVIIGAGAAGQVKSSDYTLGVDAFAPTPLSSTLATEKAAADYADNAVDAALSGLADGKIVLGDGNDANKVKDSGVSIVAQGSATAVAMDPTSDAEVPTSKAVAAYVNDGLADLITDIEALQAAVRAM